MIPGDFQVCRLFLVKRLSCVDGLWAGVQVVSSGICKFGDRYEYDKMYIKITGNKMKDLVIHGRIDQYIKVIPWLTYMAINQTNW